MSRSVNLVILVGNVGADPEIRSTGAGTKVASVSLATNRQRKDRFGAIQTFVEWHRLVLWDKLAEIAEDYIRKGDKLHIQGRIEYQTDKGQDGVTRYYTDIVVRELVMLGSAKGAPESAPVPGADDDDDLPF